MILADTTAWVEFIRDRQLSTADYMSKLLVVGMLATTEPVIMEVLAGARNARHEGQLRNLLASVELRSVEHLGSWESAARVYRSCRAGGFTPRSQLDCLIAAVAIREDIEVLHCDRDFDRIAEHTPLRIAPV